MKLQRGDVFDRISILILKMIRVDADIKDELSELLLELGITQEEANVFIGLLEINNKIWDLEFDIRRGKEKELGLEEVGRRAITIRDFNKKRVTLKNSISKYKDIKINHVSA